MYTWLDDRIGAGAAILVITIIALLVAIVVISLIVSLVRRLTAGVYVAGGKTRAPRLSVRDAVAVDKTRRLVLISRDNVEHLILIGGPTDLVIETDIAVEHQQKQPLKEPAVQNIPAESEPVRKDPEVDNRAAIPQNEAALRKIIMEQEAVLQTDTSQDYEVEQYVQEPQFSVPNDTPAEEIRPMEQTVQATEPTPSSARLHPTYPLKQVSEGIYSGRAARNPDGEPAPGADKALNLRIENPYRKMPQQPTTIERKSQETRSDPQFENELNAAIKNEE